MPSGSLMQRDLNIGVDNFMIDLNGLFHTSAQKVYKYGNYKLPTRLLGKVRRPPNGLKQQIKVFEDVCKTIEHLVKVASPRKNLILCIDGPAPIAKQSQQRQRRFRSANEKSEEEIKSFDSNCLTPGTKFMDFLSKYIDWYIKKRISEDPQWKQFNVVFSNEKVPGEGEHKIINWMRAHGNPKDSYCIHGLDADLIMLALGTHMEKFYILREDMYDYNNEFFVIDVGSVGSELVNKLRWSNDGAPFSEVACIDDFILLCFMVGNDFLPHIPSIEIIQGGIDIIMDVYKNVCEEYGHMTSRSSGNVLINKKPLMVLMGTIAQYEKGSFENKLLKKNRYFPDPVLDKCARFDNGKYNLDIQKYRKEYYAANFSHEDQQKDICHQYVDGMQWVLSYYTKGVPDWSWYFPYQYAPFAHDIARYLPTYRPYEPSSRGRPSLPFEQLLSVLPPKSSSLIPEPLNELLTSSSSPLRKYYPDEIKIDLAGKKQEWAGVVLLPFVDYTEIRKEYKKLISKVNPSHRRRDKLGNNFIYENVDSDYFFRSFYGDIPKCTAISKTISF